MGDDSFMPEEATRNHSLLRDWLYLLVVVIMSNIYVNLARLTGSND